MRWGRSQFGKQWMVYSVDLAQVVKHVLRMLREGQIMVLCPTQVMHLNGINSKSNKSVDPVTNSVWKRISNLLLLIKYMQILYLLTCRWMLATKGPDGWWWCCICGCRSDIHNNTTVEPSLGVWPRGRDVCWLPQRRNVLCNRTPQELTSCPVQVTIIEGTFRFSAWAKVWQCLRNMDVGISDVTSITWCAVYLKVLCTKELH